MKTFDLLIKDITASLNFREDDIFIEARQKLKRTALSISPISFSLYKKSIDARKQKSIRLVFTVLCKCEVSDNFDVSLLSEHGITVLGDESDLCVKYGKSRLEDRPVIVGMGPAGIFCALVLAERGYRPIVIERGDEVKKRKSAVDNFYKTKVLDTESNIQFGAGGAGTFSDGKLVTRINDPLTNYVLKTLHSLGAPEDVLLKAKPHVGTDKLLSVVEHADSRIKSLGGEILYRTRLDDIRFSSDGRVNSVVCNSNEEIKCGCLVLCVGHSARDTYDMLMKKDVLVAPKPFSVGVRIEHLREDIDRALYGDFAFHPALGSAEYNLSHNTKSRGVYTFCMCPGGEVVAAASEENSIVVNGMSNYKRDGKNSNSAIAVSVFVSDYGGTVQGAISFQRELEKTAFCVGGGGYSAPITTLGSFFEKKKSIAPARVKPSYMNGDNYTLTDFSSFMPSFLYNSLADGISSFDKKIRGFASPEAILTAYETRTSAPLRILRSDDRTAIGHSNLYPAGEGAGYAGGITSAAIDGIRCALSIISTYAPIN